MTSTGTVEIYEGYSDDVLDRGPEHLHELELYSGEPDRGLDFSRRAPRSPPADADEWEWSGDIAFTSGPIEIFLDVDVPAFLFIHTNDSYHNPTDWSRALEGGLRFGPDLEDARPFGCEIWGRVVMWAALRSDPE